jgi:hypothetical protein
MNQVVNYSRTIEEDKADEFAEIVRNEVRNLEGFAEAEETARDAMFLGVAQKFVAEDGGFLETDDDDAPDATNSGEMLPAVFRERVGNSNVLIFGYMPLDSYGRLTLFSARYEDDKSVKTLSQNEFKSRVERAFRFFRLCYEDPEQFNDNPAVSELAKYIDQCAIVDALKGVRIVFATNLRLSSSDYDRQADVGGMEVTYDIYDIDRLYRTSDQSIGVDDIDVDFESLPCGALPCLEATGKDYQYKSYLLMLGGETLAHLFKRFGSRLYDTNLRSYLESKTKVNKGMIATIRSVPQKFLAYNNGLTAIASRIDVAHRHGRPCVTRVVGLQIVNGAQTTSTIYKVSADKRNPADLSKVHVVMKLTKTEPEDIDAFVPEITEFANTQNPIKGSDLQANKFIHRQMETLARETMCPGAEPKQWFYERTRGAYQAALAREGTTAKKRLEFEERIPSANRFDKTDLAVFHMAWCGRPDSVSRGPQKNFMEFTKSLTAGGLPLTEEQIDSKFFKEIVAKAIIYNAARKVVAKCGIPKIPSSVAAYLVACFAHRFGTEIRLGLVWDNQAVSDGLKALFERWAPEVNSTIIGSNAQDMLLPEWCKKESCWAALKAHGFDADGLLIPEISRGSQGSRAAILLTQARPTLPLRVEAAQEIKPTVALDAHPKMSDVQITMKVTPAEWGKIAEWVASEPGFKSFHQTFAYSMATYAAKGWFKEPSERQAKIAAELARGASRASVIQMS